MQSAALQEEPARLWRVRLGSAPGTPGEVRSSLETWRPRDGRLAPVVAWGGNALGLVALLEHLERDGSGPSPLLIAAGAGVRAGWPTAARASILARAPLGGLLSEGLVGGDLGVFLAGSADVLWIEGELAGTENVLVLEDGAARIEPCPGLAELDPAAAWRRLSAAHPGAAILRVGPAAHRDVPFANLASGPERPSFVGRGGLGSALTRLGLGAIVLHGTAPPVAANPELLALLLRSPRLAARAAGGTLEQFERTGVDPRSGLAPERVGAVLDSIERARSRRHGCRGCPTPCGWTFERPDNRQQGARYAALEGLGARLGLDPWDEALVLLEACDRLGLDSKEAGGVLELATRARAAGRRDAGPERGDLAGMRAALEGLALGRSEGEGLAGGTAALARSLDWPEAVSTLRGQFVRPPLSFTQLLGQCVSAGGVDAMRSFPFGVEALDQPGLEELLGEALPAAAADPDDPAGKAAVVAWHEEVVSAVDLTGFCSFSSAGLLADRVTTLAGLARWIVPDRWHVTGDADPARRLRAIGATLVLLRRAINRRLGAGPDQDLPAWAGAHPGLADEVHAYRRRRGLDEQGHPRAEVWRELGSATLLDPVPPVGSGVSVSGGPDATADPAGAQAAAGRRPGVVVVRSSGSLGPTLGGERRLQMGLPAPLLEVLQTLAEGDGELRGRLLRGTAEGPRIVPAVFLEGRKLGPSEPVPDGAVLDLVLALAGG